MCQKNRLWSVIFIVKNTKHQSVQKTGSSQQKNISEEEETLFYCLGHHQVSDCCSKYHCQYCNKKHHTAICDMNIKPQEKELLKVDRKWSFSTCWQFFWRQWFLQFRLTLYQQTLRACLTMSFQQSFITKEYRRELHTQCDGLEIIQPSAFGRLNNYIQHVNTVTVYLMTE